MSTRTAYPWIAAAITAGALLQAGPAAATNGYMAHGYGTESQGMAGAGLTEGTDALASAENPALGVKMGGVAGGCVGLFMPHREVTVTGMGALPAGTTESKNDLFVMPCVGSNYVVQPDTTVGVLMYGNGGMDTHYSKALFANYSPFGSTSPTGVDMMQAFLGVNIAHKVTDTLSLGVSPVLAVQRFKATGLQPFTFMSTSPANVTNNGYSYSYGGGVKLGAVWDATPMISFGLSGTTPMWMSKFSGYSGLFAEGGSFDLPAWTSEGITVRPAKGLALLFEHQHIFYSQIKSIANSGTVPITPQTMLGASNGLGFGWQDMDVFRIGVEWKATDKLTATTGFSHASDFTTSNQVLFNILAPATINNHVSVGGSYQITDRTSLAMAYTKALSSSLTGTSPLAPGQTIKLQMDQDVLTFGVNYKF